LRIPESRITNDVEDARRFITQHGSSQTVYKAFSGTEHAWRETRLLRPGELDMIENVRFAPVIFQEYIPIGVDLRITVVGDRLFAAAIHSLGTEYEVDFRMVMTSARFEEVTLPPEVAEALHILMQRLGLVYGAIDMRLTPDGEYVFLEINPAGQWLFVEERTGQPITEALVDLMLARD
jgi:glutathione synthase/RimK-type ligase-like ATP-grasp enzyme